LDRDERALIRSCLEQDENACRELVERFAPMVGTVIWRATGDRAATEDLAQETFLRVFRGLGRFDGRAKLSTWIYTIAHRVAVDHIRRAGRWREAGVEDIGAEALDAVPANDTGPEAMLEQEELAQLVREQLAELPEKYRMPLVYAAIDGLDYETVGAAIGVRAGTVKTLRRCSLTACSGLAPPSRAPPSRSSPMWEVRSSVGRHLPRPDTRDGACGLRALAVSVRSLACSRESDPV
jgi:RNA polymerase sigma-70 factor (ECF subfamily)